MGNSACIERRTHACSCRKTQYRAGQYFFLHSSVSVYVRCGRQPQNISEHLSISVAACTYPITTYTHTHTHFAFLDLTAASSSQPVILTEAGLGGDDKSPSTDSFTAPKEPFDKRLGRKPNILMLPVIVIAYVCVTEYLGDVKCCFRQLEKCFSVKKLISAHIYTSMPVELFVSCAIMRSKAQYVK